MKPRIIASWPTEIGRLSSAEAAAANIVVVVGSIAPGMGLGKWDLIRSRVSVAAKRADTGPAIWEELAPHLRGLADGVEVTHQTAAVICELLATPGVRDELASNPELAVLRARATIELQRNTN